MNLQTARTKRTLLLVAQGLVFILIAVSPRALLAPALSFNRSMESKRPKSPKNIVRVDSTRVANAEKQPREPRAPRAETSLPNPQSFSLRTSNGDGTGSGNLVQLTRPAYLRLHESALPQSQSSPPA